VSTVTGETRVAEVARMLGGEHLSSTSLAHAQEMLDGGRSNPPGAGGAQHAEAPVLAPRLPKRRVS
jgi:DNA repair protein RecN (Recombination protein N)